MLYTFRMDDFACGHYRILWPASEIDPKGERITNIALDEADGVVTARVLDGRVKGLENVPTDMDAILLQRPTNMLLAQCIPFLQGQGIRVIVDVDDDLHSLSPRHPSWTLLHSLPNHSVDVLSMACKHANVVVCSTPQIKERYAPDNGVVVRNRIPSHHFGILPDEEFMELNPYTFDPHIGWPVSIGTHPDDGQQVQNSLARCRVPVRVVGPEHQRGKSILGVEPTFDGEVLFENWIPRVKTIHTGIAPLADTRFNQAKSALKPLEFAVAGVPFVRSTTPEFEALGAGLGAENKRQWYSHLRRLLEDESFRYDETQRNLAIAHENRYDLGEVKAEWEYAWFEAYASPKEI